MDLRLLKTFQTIVKRRSFQKAAEELQYVQSTVTMQIKKLESDLGVQLLERSKKVRLTEAGRLFYEQAELLLKNYEYLQNLMKEWEQGEAGMIRLGAMEPAASWRLPALLASFRERHPNVQLRMQIANTYVLHRMLEDDIIDLAICTTPDSGEGMLFEPLFTEKLGLLVPAGSELSAKPEIVLQDLENQPLLLTTTACPFRRELERLLAEKGVTPKWGPEVGTLSALPFYVKQGFGGAFVPCITVAPPPEGTVLKPIADWNVGLVTGLLRKSGNTTLGLAGDRLLAALRESLTNSALGSASIQKN